MPLFYQRGDILHFSRSFSIFRQGSCLISLCPYFPSLSPNFRSPPHPFPLFNPRFLNFVRCSRVFATPHFPNTRKRYISIIRCNRQLEYSQPEALRKLCHSFCHTATTQVYGCQTNLRLPIIHLSPARRKYYYRSPTQHYVHLYSHSLQSTK